MKCNCFLKFCKINRINDGSRKLDSQTLAQAPQAHDNSQPIRILPLIEAIPHQISNFKRMDHLFTTIVSGALRGFLLALGALPLGVGVALRKQRPQAMWPL